MNYLEKEQLILETLKNTNYEAFNGNSNEAIGFVQNHLMNIAKYPTAVVKADMKAVVYKTDEVTTEANNTKKTAGMSLIESITAINDLCDKLGIEKFMDIDMNDTDAIYDAAGDYMKEIFFGTIGSH